MLALGTATGLIVTLIWGPIISSWGGGNLSDALTLLGAVSVLIVVGAIACVLQAWRAATLDPMQVLRAEKRPGCCRSRLAGDRYWLHSLGVMSVCR